MKTILSTLLLAITTALSASVNPIDLVVKADPTSHTLTLRTTTDVRSTTKVQIVDAAGIILHTAQLDSGQYLNTRFQMAALPAGNYRVVVSDRTGRIIQPLRIDQEGIVADPALATTSYYPTVDLKNDLLTINYLNTGGHNVNIRLSDIQGNEVISDRLPKAFNVQRAYSLENLPSGEYYVTVSSADVPSYTTSLRLD